jgi:hypothetical protein
MPENWVGRPFLYSPAIDKAQSVALRTKPDVIICRTVLPAGRPIERDPRAIVIGPPLLEFRGGSSMRIAPRVKADIEGRTAIVATLQRNFAEWIQAIGVISDFNEMVTHPAYRRIVAMGKPVIPEILAQLKKGPSLMAWALFDITGENPVRESDHGSIDKITRAWLKWGKRYKYIK